MFGIFSLAMDSTKLDLSWHHQAESQAGTVQHQLLVLDYYGILEIESIEHPLDVNLTIWIVLLNMLRDRT